MISLESVNPVLRVDSNINSVFSKHNNWGNQQKAINCSCVLLLCILSCKSRQANIVRLLWLQIHAQ